MRSSLAILILQGEYGICRLSPKASFPDWAEGEGLMAMTRSAEELSLLCPAERIPEGVPSERGWRGLKVAGPLDFGMVGILAAISSVLAQAGISIFAISTYDTDYIFVKESDLAPAVTALSRSGHRISGE